MAPRELFLSTYSGTYRGKTATVSDGELTVTFPDLSMKNQVATRQVASDS
jgi:hypothetical protein